MEKDKILSRQYDGEEFVSGEVKGKKQNEAIRPKIYSDIDRTYSSEDKIRTKDVEKVFGRLDTYYRDEIICMIVDIVKDNPTLSKEQIINAVNDYIGVDEFIDNDVKLVRKKRKK